MKVNYRFSNLIFCQKTVFLKFSFLKKGTRFWPKKGSYIRDIGGFVSYIGVIGNIGALAGLQRAAHALRSDQLLPVMTPCHKIFNKINT